MINKVYREAYTLMVIVFYNKTGLSGKAYGNIFQRIG